MDSLAFLRAVASLSVTLGLIVLLAWAWRRFGQPLQDKWGHRFARTSHTGMARPQPRLAVLESKRLNPQTTLYLVKLDDTEHLLATTAAQTTLIHTRPVLKPSSKPSAKSVKVMP